MPVELIEKLFRHSQDAVQKIHLKGAFNPILWLCGIAMPLLLLGAYIFRSDVFLRQFFAISMVVPMGVACLGFIYFALTKPEKLQSEDYQLKHESIRMIDEKSIRVPLTPTSLEGIVGTSPVSLPEPPPKEDII